MTKFDETWQNDFYDLIKKKKQIPFKYELFGLSRMEVTENMICSLISLRLNGSFLLLKFPFLLLEKRNAICFIKKAIK